MQPLFDVLWYIDISNYRFYNTKFVVNNFLFDLISV